jgi:hypothetical protein
MQACVESGRFCTVGILFLDKFFWEINGCVVRKNLSFFDSFQTQMEQGFLGSDRPKVLILRHFLFDNTPNARWKRVTVLLHP